MNCNIWDQSPAQRNYEHWLAMCSILKRNPNSYRPLIEAEKRLKKEIEAKHLRR